MGSSYDSRYWVCRSCFREFDWRDTKNNPADHDEDQCRRDRKDKKEK